MRKYIGSLFLVAIFFTQSFAQQPQHRVLVVGSGVINAKILSYFASLLPNPNPKICWIPTASGDNPANISQWYETALSLNIKPFVLKLFIGSQNMPEEFEDLLLGMDAIFVGGGNTLSMLGVWKAHGIDQILKKAYEKGILLGGGSAGAVCWFENGVSSARPIQLSKLEGLGLLKGSFVPHYAIEKNRKETVKKVLIQKEFEWLYGLDDGAAMLFENGELKKCLTTNPEHKAWKIYMKDNQLIEEILAIEML